MRGQTVSGSARPARDFYLSSAYDALYPVAANVRSGVTYGPGPAYTGTCAVPPAASVAVGVPVDDTTGTAAITAASIRAAVGLASANLDTQLSDIPAAIRSNLATELGRLDAAISTRLAASSYTAPPTAAAIASAVDSALTRTGFSLTSQERSAIATAVEQSILNDGDGQAVLNAIVGAIGNQNIDQIALVAAIRADLERTGGTLASRLASSAYTAPPSAADNASAVWSAGSRTITGGTVDTLTNAPTVPTPSQIATQVRTELSEELGRMDVATSSRLAASSYTAPPSAGTIATAVWSAATRTLTTAIDNSSTIAAAVWSAVSRTITGGTVDTLTNAPDVPTPPEIAEAVRDELEQELARMSNVATTQEVGAIVEGTFD